MQKHTKTQSETTNLLTTLVTKSLIAIPILTHAMRITIARYGDGRSFMIY